MNRRDQFSAGWRSSAAGGALTVLLGWCFLLTPLGRGLVLSSYDLLYLFRPDTNPAALHEAIIVNMDEDSRSKLRQDPNGTGTWDRAQHARLLRALTSRGAKVVVFDVLFANDDPAASDDADRALAGAIRAHGRVVLGASVQTSATLDAPGTTRVIRPAGVFTAVAPWGVTEWPLENSSGSIPRRQLNYVDFTNLAWQAAVAFGRAPARRNVTRWLNYYGPGGTLPTVNYASVLETNALPGDAFAGKAVFVGEATLITASGPTRDSWPTPYSLWSSPTQPAARPTAGVELQATTFLNLVRGEWLEDLGLRTEALLVLAFGLAFGVGLSLVRPWWAGGWALAGVALVAAGAISLAWRQHLWFPWLIVCAVQVPGALCWAVLGHTQRLIREKEALRGELLLAQPVAPRPGCLATGSSVDGPATLATVSSAPAPRSDTSAGDGEAAAPPPIPNHDLLRRIGHGAYGEVWLARDDIGTFHAVKIIRRSAFRDAAPFEREFRGLQKFTPVSRSHAGFVHILHVGREDRRGYFFSIMELGDDQRIGQQIVPATYQAKTLATELRHRRRLELGQCLSLGVELTAALDCLHRAQLIHRDIKPANIIFVHGAPKLADVGLVTDIATPGRDASFLGTDGYIAPEGPGTPGADVYSLGKVLYEAATGRDRQEFPALPATLVEWEEKGLALLNDIVLKACEDNPRDRYQTAAQMHADLQRIQRQLDLPEATSESSVVSPE